MSFSFLEPALVFPAVLLALGAAALFAWRRKSAPALFLLGSACFSMLAAGPMVTRGGVEPVHAVVLDVSGSMESRLLASRAELSAQLEAATKSRDFRRLQISDAVRPWGEPVGGSTLFGSLSAISGDAEISGDVVLLTDGHGSLDELCEAIDPSRLVLLRAPEPASPDAAISAISGPGSLLPGASGVMTVELLADRDTLIKWRVFEGSAESSTGSMALPAGVKQELTHAFVAGAVGLLKIRLVIEAEGDREPRNNVATLSVHVGGRRLILYCRDSSVREQDDALLARLRSDQLNEVRVQSKLPASSPELEGVATVVINDLSLEQGGLVREQLTWLANWVRGGGRLMMAGVRSAFGPGGYRGTPLEDLMPVTFRPDDDKPRKILLLLDCSDSMRGAVGGQTRLDMLKLAALRVLNQLDQRDQVAIVGFAEDVDRIEFVPVARKSELEQRVAGLKSRTTTRIRSAMDKSISAFQGSGNEQNRVLVITDGDDGEAEDRTAWRDLGLRAKQKNLAVDVVLTEAQPRYWERAMRDAQAPGVTASVSAAGFAELLDTLEAALKAADQGLIDDGAAHGGFVVDGLAATPSLICRTSARKDLRIDDGILEARTPPASPEGSWKPGRWPLLYRREAVGRTVALCTETYGGPLWSDPAFLGEGASGRHRRGLDQALGFLLGGTEWGNLRFLPGEGGAELRWSGVHEPPESDLKLGNGDIVRLESRGRWRLASYPLGDEILVFAGESLIQRVALPQPPPRELTATGDNESFFLQAKNRGIRVIRTLADWQPAGKVISSDSRTHLGWIAAALGIACLLAGYAMRRR